MSLKEIILKKIQMNELAMRPKAYFTFKIVALIAAAVGVLVTSVFLCNFILFSIRVNGQGALLGFGWQGFFTFLQFFPWFLLGLDIIFVITLEWLLRQFRFGYKSPLLYTFIGILVLTILASILLDDHVPFNDRLLDEADHQRLPPPLNDFYEHARHHHALESGICLCTIVAINGNMLTVENKDDPMEPATRTVMVPADNPDADIGSLHIGDTVFIAGIYHDGIVDVYGIQSVAPNIAP